MMREKADWIAIDQRGDTVKLYNTATPRKALLDKLYATHAEKSYIDTKAGVLHVGYTVRGNWYRVYKLIPIGVTGGIPTIN
jgi:hypothetical protein